MRCKNKGLKILGLSGGGIMSRQGPEIFIFLNGYKKINFKKFHFFSVECTDSNKLNLPTQKI